jgi:hypothetical protein
MLNQRGFFDGNVRYMYSRESQGEVDDGKCAVPDDCILCGVLLGRGEDMSFSVAARILQRASL